ncbi:MAG: LptA/OstA family protein [Fimbriimonadaceae bacterium]
MAVAILAVGALLALAQQPLSDETFSVSSDRISGNRRDGVVIYAGNVLVTYGVTRIRADKVTVFFESGELRDPILAAFWTASQLIPAARFPSFEGGGDFALATRRGIAEGNVALTDPDGTMKADLLEFNWDLKIGRATNVDADVAGVKIKAREARISPGRYELIDASGTSCPELYTLRTRRVVVIPADKVVIERPRISVGPLSLPQLPNQTYSLDQRVTGLRLPSVSFRRGSGFGLTWNSGILLDSKTALTAGMNAFPGALPSYGLEIARSSIEPTRATGLISPRSELTERFSYGYLENVTVGSPEAERRYLSAARDTLSLGSYWNQGAQSLTGDTRFSKLAEVAYERGGSHGDIDGVAQIRAHRIKENDGPFQNRLVAQIAVGLRPAEILPGLSTLVRLNLQGYRNEDSFYGWGRVQTGLVFDAGKLRIGAAYLFGGETGTAAFSADRLYSANAFHVRGDLDLGATKISVLAKYDFDRRRWFDHEYSISQTIGCLEPYVLWRQFPSDYRFGVRLRVDAFLDLLRKREFSRKQEAAGKG